MKLSFEKFQEAVVKMLKGYLPDSYKKAELSLRPITKNNGVVRNTLTVSLPKENVAPNLRLDNFYQLYLDDKGTETQSLDNVLEKMAKVIVENRPLSDYLKAEVNETLMDYEAVKSKIIPCLRNGKANSEYIADKPHRRFLDMFITYKVLIQDYPNTRMTTGITHSIKEMWDVTEEDLYRQAISNMSSLFSYKLMPLEYLVIARSIGMPLSAVPGASELDFGQFYVAVNESFTDGATMLLDDALLKDISTKSKADLLILPSSVDEVIMTPCPPGMAFKENIAILRNMVREVNSTEVPDELILSDAIYRYSAKKGLTIA